MSIILNAPKNDKASRPGRRSNRENMLERVAKSRARQIVRDNSLTPSMISLIQMLSTCGAMTTKQVYRSVRVSLRSLQRCHKDHFVDHLFAPEAMKEILPKHSSLKYLRIWKLGILGEHLARELKLKPITYEGYAIQQIGHDVLCAEVVLRFVELGAAHGYSAEWRSKHDARIRGKVSVVKKLKNGDERTKIVDVSVIEPDSLLILRKDDEIKPFVFEFHNERGKRRGLVKVDRYRLVEKNQSWKKSEGWGLSSMPVIVVGYRYKSVLPGYLEPLATGNHNCRFIAPHSIYEWGNSSETPTFYDLNAQAKRGETIIDPFSID